MYTTIKTCQHTSSSGIPCPPLTLTSDKNMYTRTIQENHHHRGLAAAAVSAFLVTQGCERISSSERRSTGFFRRSCTQRNKKSENHFPKPHLQYKLLKEIEKLNPGEFNSGKSNKWESTAEQALTFRSTASCSIRAC